MNQHLTRFEQANLLAGHAVSYATAYLDGRHDAAKLGDNADRLFLDLLVVETEETSAFLIPVQLLAITMMRTAKHVCGISVSRVSDRVLEVHGTERAERWHQIMASLVDLIIHDSRQLKRAD